MNELKDVVLLALPHLFFGSMSSQKLGRAVYLHVAHEYGASIADIAADLGCTMASIYDDLLMLHNMAVNGDAKAIRALELVGDALTARRRSSRK